MIFLINLTEKARLIRSFNVLRQYEEDEFISHLKTLTQGLENGGLLIEGTSNPTGRFWVANLIRKQKDLLKYEGLVFSTNFHDGFIPQDFQPFLPKNLDSSYASLVIQFSSLFKHWSKAAQNKIHIRERSFTTMVCILHRRSSSNGISGLKLDVVLQDEDFASTIGIILKLEESLNI